MRRRQEDFLQQIRLHPHDDEIRLIFADWLEEIGDERAEFIRVQCESARSQANGSDDILRENLRSRETELAGLWRAACLEELQLLGVKDVRFERGFVSRIYVEGASFLPRFKTLAEWAPALERVLWQKIPRQSADPIRRFFDSPIADTITTLDLRRNNLGAAGWEALAKAPKLAELRSLSLRENAVGGQGMRELMKCPYLSGLTKWDLTETELSPVDARGLARAESLRQIEELLLGHNRIGDAGLRSLANAPGLRTLKRLDVANNQFWHEGVRAVAESPILTNLSALDLSGNEIGDTGADFLATGSNFGRLQELNLAGCGIKETGLATFAKSPYLIRLTSLNLSHNPLRQGLAGFLESPTVGRLQDLDLRNCQLDNQSIRTLINSQLPFSRLDLRENPLINRYSRDQLQQIYGERVLL